MGGYSPTSRVGLIALIAARRIKAEKLRHIKAMEDKSPEVQKALAAAAKKERGSGWFRR